MSRYLSLHILSCLLLSSLAACVWTDTGPPEGLNTGEAWQAETPERLFDGLKWAMEEKRFDILYDRILSRHNRERNERQWEKEKAALLASLRPGGTLSAEQKKRLAIYGVYSAEGLKPLTARAVFIRQMNAEATPEMTTGWGTIIFSRARVRPDGHGGTLTMRDHRNNELTLRIVYEDGGWRWRKDMPDKPEKKNE